jgi:hypothetical protein
MSKLTRRCFACPRSTRILPLLVKALRRGYMLAAVQKAHATHVRMQPRYPLFLPLVVDITDPAQANYSLPGLFLLLNFPKGVPDAPAYRLPRTVADCPIIILETYCGEKRDCLSYKAAIQDLWNASMVQDSGWPVFSKTIKWRPLRDFFPRLT